MSEVLVIYDTPISGADGQSWTAQACGRLADDGLWEGWIEFLPRQADASPVRTGRETEQPNRDDLLYWAQGLTQAYLEGAVERALAPSHPIAPMREVPAQSVFGSPAATVERSLVDRAPHALLNPFEVYLQGEDILVKELGALDTPRLRDIAVAYGFGEMDRLAAMGHGELTSLIVAGARAGRSGGLRETDLRP
jgi:hypothetical protein